jgi:type 1 glutamine amidotransferase
MLHPYLMARALGGDPGHGPTAFGNPNYRRLVANAIRWAASPAAHELARQNPVPVA